MKIKWGSEDMGKRNDKARDKDVDKGNKKSVSEAIRSMFEIKDDGNSVNKLKTQVKGYSVTAITERTLKKNKLGDVMTAVCSKEELEEEIREKVEETLKVCGLFPFRNWPVSALSFGQKKRVTIASVLVQDPELIILDEPTAGQDFHHYTEIMEFLRGLNEKGVTVVMITHDMHLMLEYTPRALVFADGRLIADRSAAAVLCDPQLIRQAALKETSLFTLANQLGISPAEEFVQRFIEEDREVRSHGR